MRESKKNKIILALGLLTMVLLISSISSCRDAARQEGLVNQERRARMELEEKVLSLSSRNIYLEQEIKQLQKVLNPEALELKQELEKGN